MKKACPLAFSLLLAACQATPTPVSKPDALVQATSALKSYDSLAKYQVMVVGTLHFGEDVLEAGPQKSIARLVEQLGEFQPTKVVVEWEPARSETTNQAYREYLQGSYDISGRYNEVFQLGFRLAAAMGHERIFLFDDQTDFIGSLAQFSTPDDPFSFDLFTEYARQHDDGFFDAHEQALISTFEYNQGVLDGLDLHDRVALLNSPQQQHINAQRMHLYEVRVGIGDHYAGPDWLGRWYRRNVRMMSNVLAMAEEGDRLLLIVGDNHKWTLDMLFENTPDFSVVSSWDYLRD